MLGLEVFLIWNIAVLGKEKKRKINEIQQKEKGEKKEREQKRNKECGRKKIIMKVITIFWKKKILKVSENFEEIKERKEGGKKRKKKKKRKDNVTEAKISSFAILERMRENKQKNQEVD